jgi:hypothetical protein
MSKGFQLSIIEENNKEIRFIRKDIDQIEKNKKFGCGLKNEKQQ